MSIVVLPTAWFPYYYASPSKIIFFKKEALDKGICPGSPILKKIKQNKTHSPETWFVFLDTRKGWKGLQFIACFDTREALMAFLKLRYGVSFP